MQRAVRRTASWIVLEVVQTRVKTAALQLIVQMLVTQIVLQDVNQTAIHSVILAA